MNARVDDCRGCPPCLRRLQTGREYVMALLGVLSHVTETRVIKYAFTLLEDVLDCKWNGDQPPNLVLPCVHVRRHCATSYRPVM